MADRDGFVEWCKDAEPRLRRALVAAYGADRGREATAEALAWAWAHQGRLDGLDHPIAYLFRVGQSRSRHRLTRFVPRHDEWSDPWIEPALGAAMSTLSERQRITVVLVHSYQWTLTEVADLLDIKKSTVQNHLDRGLAKLRNHLEAHPDA